MTNINWDSIGRDDKGRPHGGAALDLLLDAARANGFGQPITNPWDIADTVIETADPEVVYHAARHLLALHLHRLEDKDPKVAMRNVRIADFVRVGGVGYVVTEVLNSDKPTITLKGLRMNNKPGDLPEVFCAYDRDVELDLVGRPTE